MARWDRIKSRGHVEDRRGMGPAMVGGIGAAGILLFLAVSLFGGGEQAMEIMEQFQEFQYQTPQQTGGEDIFSGKDEYEVFASTVLGSNNDLWEQIFSANNLQYQEPTMVLFRGATNSSCGAATSQVGPHYCPLDNTIYVDETFFDELQSRFGAAGGDVAEAYVMSHEVGHHVQNLLGISNDVRQAQQRYRSSANELSVQLELQADCFAGMWVYSIGGQGVLERGEILEAIDAAEAVGDDRIQEKTIGRTHPESWTHGSSEDRKKWFLMGYEHGSFNRCNTFDQR